MPYAKTGDVTTYYEIAGKGNPVVLIHGLGASHDMWTPQVQTFSKEYKVITYDIRGHQKTNGSQRRYTCQLLAEDLHYLLDDINIDEPVLCGLSLGGMIAQEFAVSFQKEIRGLVLADTAVSSAHSISDRVTKALIPARLAKWLVRKMKAERYAEWSFGSFTMDAEVKAYLIQEQMKMDREELAKLIDAVYEFKMLPLETIEVPTLILVGSNERKPVFKHAEIMRSMINDSELVVIPDAGHVSNLENPMFFNEVVGRFLRKVFV